MGAFSLEVNVQQFLTTVAAGVVTYVAVNYWKNMQANDGSATIENAILDDIDGIDDTSETTIV